MASSSNVPFQFGEGVRMLTPPSSFGYMIRLFIIFLGYPKNATFTYGESVGPTCATETIPRKLPASGVPIVLLTIVCGIQLKE